MGFSTFNKVEANYFKQGNSNPIVHFDNMLRAQGNILTTDTIYNNF